MRKSTIIWVIVAAAIISGGLVTYFIFGNNTPIGTQVSAPNTSRAVPGDRDGDGTADWRDYLPDDPTK